MIGFISTDYLWASRLKNRNNIQYFLMAETSPYSDEARLGLTHENVTLMVSLVPPKSNTKRFERFEDRCDFEACVSEYSMYLSENGLFESLETIIKTSENDKQDIVFLSCYDDISYLEALAIILKRRYSLCVLGTTELCGRSMYIPDYIGIDNSKTLNKGMGN